MKVYELLDFNKELLFKIHKAGLKADDFKYVDLYNEFLRLKSNGEKITYIVCCLSDEYKISERLVYSVINKMQQDVCTEKTMQL